MHSPHVTAVSDLPDPGAGRARHLTIVAGSTALGAELAQQMSVAGYPVLVIDSSKAALARLGLGFGGIQFEGDATNPEILKQCSIDNAALLLALFEDDATNLLVGRIAEAMFRVPDVRILLANGSNRSALAGSSIRTICPVEILSAWIIRDLGWSMEART